jgi:hypothetical protein
VESLAVEFAGGAGEGTAGANGAVKSIVVVWLVGALGSVDEEKSG